MNNINSLFVPYAEALEMKSLGFDEHCFAKFIKESFQYNTLGKPTNYNDESYGVNIISAPTFSQCFYFFRDKHDLFISIVHYENGYSINDLRRFETYEEAELECIRYLINIVKVKLNTK